MQWDATPTGGFTSRTPWLPLVDPAARNVGEQRGDEESLLALYRRLIAARRSVPALGRGTHRSIFGVAPDVLAWTRELDGERVLVLLNTGGESRTCSLDRVGVDAGEVVVATGQRAGRVELGELRLEPLEGVALSL
jgi:alpha-glucosidase